jgi:hypothetical protein
MKMIMILRMRKMKISMKIMKIYTSYNVSNVKLII